MGDDCSHFNQPFSEAFNRLSGDMSFNMMVCKLGLPKSTVYNFSKNKQKPTIEQIKKIAKGFDLDPRVFREYRLALISSHLERYLYDNPEESIRLAWELGDEL